MTHTYRHSCGCYITNFRFVVYLGKDLKEKDLRKKWNAFKKKALNAFEQNPCKYCAHSKADLMPGKFLTELSPGYKAIVNYWSDVQPGWSELDAECVKNGFFHSVDLRLYYKPLSQRVAVPQWTSADLAEAKAHPEPFEAAMWEILEAFLSECEKIAHLGITFDWRGCYNLVRSMESIRLL